MATLKPVILAFGLVALCACSKLEGFSGEVPPFATYTVEVDGDLTAVRPPGDTGAPKLAVALLWGQQWLTEALCLEGAGPIPIDPRDDASKVAPVLASGCRDPFGFVPLRVETNVPIELGVPASFDLIELPGADVLVGDLTARVAYGSLVVYDDRDGDGTLTLARPNRLGSANGMMMNDPTPTVLADRIYGASFVTMTAPDQRVAYREGAFVQAAFYPRAGCSDPPPAFSVAGAGGFTADAAIAATVAGTLPAEDPASCTEAAPTDATIEIAVQAPADVVELGCTENNDDSSVRYREPEADAPDFTNRTTACVHVPSFDTPSDTVELIVTGIVTGTATDSCKGLTHYVLKGCRSDPNCALPDWDHSLAPPNWWPC